jgi:hypothetical protein
MKERLFNALVFGLATTAVQLGAIDWPATAQAWVGVAGIFLIAFYGKYSTSTALLTPDRKPWTEDEKRAVLGLPPKQPVKG